MSYAFPFGIVFSHNLKEYDLEMCNSASFIVNTEETIIYI